MKIDLKNMDLTTVDPRPIIRDTLVKVKCVKIEFKPSKNNPQTQVMHMTMQTLEQQTSTNGNPVAPGRQFLHPVVVTPTEKLTEQMIAERLVELQLGFIGEKTKDFDSDDILNQEATAKFGVSKGEDGTDQNRIVGFVVKA